MFDYPISADGNTPLARQSAYWQWRLWRLFAVSRRFSDMPDDINIPYLQWSLATQGSATMFMHDGKYYALRAAYSGYDAYSQPTDYVIANPVLPQITGKYHIDGIWLCNNLTPTGAQLIINEYARQLSVIDTNISVASDNAKQCIVYVADTPEGVKKLQKMYRDMQEGKPAIIEMPILSDTDQPVYFAPAQNYNIDRMIADRRSIIADFLTAIGINNNPLEKSERLISREIDSNKDEIALNRCIWNDRLQTALTEGNKLWNLNMAVETLVASKTVDAMVSGVEEEF